MKMIPILITAIGVFIFLMNFSSAGIAYNQSRSVDSGPVTKATLAFNNANTAGSLIIVAIRDGGAGGNVSVNDSKNNQYYKINNQTIGGLGENWIFYANNSASGANTVQINVVNSVIMRWAIHEYTGVATSSAFDKNSSKNGSSTAVNSGSATVTNRNELIFGFGTVSGQGNFTSGTSFNKKREQVPADTNGKLATEDLIATTNGSYNANFTMSTNDVWGGDMVTFKELDSIYPNFYNRTDNNATQITIGQGNFSVNINNTNGTVGIEFNSINYSVLNNTGAGNYFNWTNNSINNGTYPYYWWAYGNGSVGNYNTSGVFYYTINNSGGTCPDGSVQTNGSTHCGGNFTNNASVGTVTWTNMGNAKVSDNTYATISLLITQQSNYLRASNFTWNIPANAVINGIQTMIERSTDTSNAVSDTEVKLMLSNGTLSSDRSNSSKWATSDQVAVYGNSSDNWGLVMNGSNINNTNFSLVISITGAVADTASIDSINMTVYYTTPATNTCSYTSGNWNLQCKDNCTITTNTNLNKNNITINGTGDIKINANITNYTLINIVGESSSKMCIVQSQSGGGFK